MISKSSLKPFKYTVKKIQQYCLFSLNLSPVDWTAFGSGWEAAHHSPHPKDPGNAVSRSPSLPATHTWFTEQSLEACTLQRRISCPSAPFGGSVAFHGHTVHMWSRYEQRPTSPFDGQCSSLYKYFSGQPPLLSLLAEIMCRTSLPYSSKEKFYLFLRKYIIQLLIEE